jgi:bifunctional non-homologous end joining protein LigD
MPVSWEELRMAVKKKKAESLYFGPDEALNRLKKAGDMFASVLTMKQKLPAAAAAKFGIAGRFGSVTRQTW